MEFAGTRTTKYGLVQHRMGCLFYNTENGKFSPVKEYFRGYNPLPTQNITAITEADEETMWIGTKSGVFALNTSTGL